eukprot:7379259-Prymnesium_polylepis.2
MLHDARQVLARVNSITLARAPQCKVRRQHTIPYLVLGEAGHIEVAPLEIVELPTTTHARTGRDRAQTDAVSLLRRRCV